MKPCPCGSGEPRYPLVDKAGLFCAYVCFKCEDRKRASYNPAIFESRSYDGTEASLEAADYESEG